MAGSRDVTTTDLFVMEIPDGGGDVTMTFCHDINFVHPDVDNGMNILTALTDDARTALGEAGLDLATAATDPIVPTQILTWDWGLKDLGDAVPTEASDPRVWDQDADGNPGISLAVDVTMKDAGTGEDVPFLSGQRYMAKRLTLELAGGALSADGRWIVGELDWSVEEVSYGADNNLLAESVPIDPTGVGDRFEMRRITGETDCAALIASHEALFAGVPD